MYQSSYSLSEIQWVIVRALAEPWKTVTRLVHLLKGYLVIKFKITSVHSFLMDFFPLLVISAKYGELPLNIKTSKRKISLSLGISLVLCLPCMDQVTKWPSEVAQSCPILCDPMDGSLPRSSVHGIFQARVLEWIAISFSGRPSRLRDWPRSSALQAEALPSEPQGKIP